MLVLVRCSNDLVVEIARDRRDTEGVDDVADAVVGDTLVSAMSSNEVAFDRDRGEVAVIISFSEEVCTTGSDTWRAWDGGDKVEGMTTVSAPVLTERVPASGSIEDSLLLLQSKSGLLAFLDGFDEGIGSLSYVDAICVIDANSLLDGNTDTFDEA